MNVRGPDVSFPAPNESHYAIRPTAEISPKGGAVRAARREHGFDVGRAARALKMPATDLISVELGKAEFIDSENYRRAIATIANAAKRKV